jgi:radical SAM superfamily enzyme YgiQ (UPF0313 family)
MYKGVRYSQRSADEIFEDIAWAAKRYPQSRRIFLADGDVMFLKFDLLVQILEELNSKFANLARVNLYANGSSILAKSADQLCELRRLKLNTLYMGLESGDEDVLKLVTKNETAEDMIKAANFAQSHGLKCSVMALLGLGGKEFSAKHAKLTASALNRMQPRLLSILRFIEVPGTKMHAGFQPLSEYEAVEELEMIISGLDLKKTVFTANHASNPLPLKGRFPQDKQKLLSIIKGMLNSNQLSTYDAGNIPYRL